MDIQKLFTDKYVIVSVRNKTLGSSKKVSKKTKEAIASAANADPKRIKATKVIFEAEEVKKIKSEQIALTLWLRGNALPAEEFLRDGCHFLHVELTEEFQQKHAESCMEIEGLVASLKARWDDIKEESRQKLGSEWEDGLLPEAESLDNEFGITYSIFHLSIPENLNPETRAKELEAQGERLKLAYSEVNEVLTDQAVTVLKAFKSRCDEYGGKGSRFHATLVTNISDFAKRFQLRNIAQNEVLESIVNAFGVWAEGLNVESLRDSELYRKQSSEVAGTFLDQLLAL